MPSARIQVYIQPRASKTEVAGLHGGALKVRIAAPPVDNAANRALIEFIAQKLGVAKSCVHIVSGSTGRRKILEVSGVTADLIAARLGARQAQPGNGPLKSPRPPEPLPFSNSLRSLR